MPSNIYRAQVVFTGATGDPEDVYVNTFHFREESGTIDASGAAFIASALDDFYGVPAGGAAEAIDLFISDDVSRVTKPLVKVYDAIVGGSPILESELVQFSAPAMTTNVPTEVAACLSFRGTLVNVPEVIPGGPAGPEGDERPASRRRGRVFIGPLTTGALAADGRIELPSFATSLVAAAVTHLRDDAVLATQGIKWGVFSDVDQVCRDVTNVWVDNAPDIQRRRGRAATARVEG